MKRYIYIVITKGPFKGHNRQHRKARNCCVEAGLKKGPHSADLRRNRSRDYVPLSQLPIWGGVPGRPHRARAGGLAPPSSTFLFSPEIQRNRLENSGRGESEPLRTVSKVSFLKIPSIGGKFFNRRKKVFGSNADVPILQAVKLPGKVCQPGRACPFCVTGHKHNPLQVANAHILPADPECSSPREVGKCNGAGGSRMGWWRVRWIVEDHEEQWSGKMSKLPQRG